MAKPEETRELGASSTSGGCWCAMSRYSFVGKPNFTLQCYCRDCQHISGGGNLPQLAVSRQGLSMTGPLKTYRRKSAAGYDLELGFCHNCGSPIYKQTTLAPDLVFLCAGSLDDPQSFSAELKPYQESRQPWDDS